MTTPRFSTLQLMQALQLGHAVAALQTLGVMDALAQACEPAALAEQFGLDATMLAGLLDHAARATDLVRREGRRYRRTKAWNDNARFLINLYGLAFGPAAAHVQTLLRHPERADKFVDRRHHTQAFEAAPPEVASVLPGLLRQLEIRRVLDLGCGPARLLICLARSDLGFRGWGVEANRLTCRAARAAVRAARVASRVQVLQGDARRPQAIVPHAVAARVQAVVASQFVNEMFGAGPVALVSWLCAVRSVLPGRWLLVADYYGRLGSARAASPMTLVHDHAQLLTGQGVPPSRLSDWAALYTQAGARLIHAVEDASSTRFVHMVAL